MNSVVKMMCFVFSFTFFYSAKTDIKMAQNNVKIVDGTIHTSDEIKEVILNAKTPFIISNMTENWSASKWSMDEFTKLFGAVQTRFKLYRKEKIEAHAKKKVKLDTPDESIPMETDCVFVKGCFEDFRKWLNQKEDFDHDLQNYSRDDYWCYADYNYMAEVFNSDTSVMESIDWSVLGFPGRNGLQSTIWVGSEEAYTPCHQDTYGLNLVAQIHGTKRWLLLPPENKKSLLPVRIPYEESSVFTRLGRTALKQHKNCLQIDLQPKQVLIVPKHWWHFVESLEASISVNTWIELKTDNVDRIQEALVQTFVYAFKNASTSSDTHWLNPGQTLLESLGDCLHQVDLAMMEDKSKTRTENEIKQTTPESLLNCLCEKEVLDSIIEVIERRKKEGA